MVLNAMPSGEDLTLVLLGAKLNHRFKMLLLEYILGVLVYRRLPEMAHQQGSAASVVEPGRKEGSHYYPLV